MASNGLVLWIILGALIVVVFAFLVFTSVMDKKKEKKFKAQKAEEEKEKIASRGNIAIWINEIKKHNDALLGNFVPSVGKLKMGEIRTKARECVSELMASRAYAMTKDTDANIDVVDAIKKIFETNSNIWGTNCTDEFKMFIEIESELEKEKYAEFKEATVAKVKETYESPK